MRWATNIRVVGGEEKSALRSSARAHTRTNSRVITHGAQTRTHFLLVLRGKKRGRERSRVRGHTNFQLSHVESRGLEIRCIFSPLRSFPPPAPLCLPRSVFLFLLFPPSSRIFVFLWESCLARREVWLFAWSAEEEEEEKKSLVKSGGKMVHNAAWRRSFLCVLALYLGFASPPCKARLFTNHWAVRIAGGPEVADRIAEKYGYRNMGQVSHKLRPARVVFVHSCLLQLTRVGRRFETRHK